MKSRFNKILKYFAIILIVLGSFSLITIILAFTSVPYWMHYNLGQDPNNFDENFIPEYVIMLGGSAMPAKDNLIRLYYTAYYAKQNDSKIIILQPKDSVTQKLMLDFLISQEISTEQIIFHSIGGNTRNQIINLKNNNSDLRRKKILAVTSPHHLTRTVLCFNKLDFENIHGIAAFDNDLSSDLLTLNDDIKGNVLVPTVESIKIRYSFWKHLQMEIDCYREYCALFYYKIKGWT